MLPCIITRFLTKENIAQNAKTASRLIGWRSVEHGRQYYPRQGNAAHENGNGNPDCGHEFPKAMLFPIPLEPADQHERIQQKLNASRQNIQAKEKIGKVGDQEERKAHEAGQAHPELRFSHNYLRVIGGLIILLK
ncbi:MAG: hypothetical protein A3J48_00140 [Candidatus Doudnabacteria bacterium RIFCSPHIGHO2_02_FULL_46_11]|uniref:Uncharacterized protein n=1 Tax=Candidatus Doudnabacteria bacterium RIFCSPHIGHO2_02_FULL_46_11 TaxID=1817832 RepID=A0A1F5P9B5_9BACT|nr:MAG: hypothetical protein A3J48_00140 [Candidatus Doudnabacteria bacterium RIFCSPHIGHO2_02_FULL_46_11]